MIWGILIALVAIGGAALFTWLIARGGGEHPVLWSVLLAVAVVLGLLLLNVSGVYYRIPVGWVVVRVASALVVIALFVLVGRSVSWKPGRLAAVIGLMVSTMAITVFALMAMPVGVYFTSLFEARGQQIAEEAGFTALFAGGRDLKVDYLPVDAIGGDATQGVGIQYEDFELQERKADGPLEMSELEAILAAGEDPFGYGMRIPSDAEYQRFEVNDRPALGAEFTLDPKGQSPKPGELPEKQSVIRILVFEMDGVQVLMKSEGAMEYQGGYGENEEYEYRPPLDFDGLLEAAASLDPVE